MIGPLLLFNAICCKFYPELSLNLIQSHLLHNHFFHFSLPSKNTFYYTTNLCHLYNVAFIILANFNDGHNTAATSVMRSQGPHRNYYNLPHLCGEKVGKMRKQLINLPNTRNPYEIRWKRTKSQHSLLIANVIVSSQAIYKQLEKLAVCSRLSPEQFPFSAFITLQMAN